LHLYHSEVVREYGLRPKGAVLLVGPPGTGKTLIAKALANWVGQISCSGRSRFINIKPAGLHEMWYGKTEENYREAFRVAREAGAADPDVPVVMFFDEVDAIGASRGGSLARTDDRVLTAFMTELDGLEARGNILVVAATNRREALDPALLRPGRLGDLELEVPRPKMAGAREIFGKYLPPHLRYGAGTQFPNEESRQAVIEAAVSQIYAPNADNRLATLTFRDGKQRGVSAAELMSGASIAKIAGDATERVGLRTIENGDPAVRAEDLHTAVADELERLTRALTPSSCRRHLCDLPDDADIVRVERARHVGRQQRYMNVA
jgi:proteasome-associated ATPase